MIVLQIIGYTLGAALIIAVLSLVVSILVWLAHQIEGFIQKTKSDWLDLKDKAKQVELNAVRVLKPDENGRNGVFFDGSVFRNTDNSEVFSMQITKSLDPIRYQLDSIQRTLLSMKGVSIAPQETVAELISGDMQVEVLPDYINLLDLTERYPVTLDNLIIGVTVNGQGKVVPIRDSIHNFMHLLNIGQTGAGKSCWALSFLAEIAMVKEAISVVCIDVHGSAFNILRDWNKLRFPVARDNKQAVALLEEVFAEADRRKALYEQVPLADSIVSYNQHTDGEFLHPWLIVIDEGTIMLADKSISEYVAKCVQGTRAYGLYVFMLGQSGHSNVITTPIRDNFPTRIAFSNEPSSIRVVLGGNPPGDLEEIPGRGWARLKGHATAIKMQSPYIKRQDFHNLITGGGPQNDMPIEGEYVDFDELVKGAAGELEKISISAVCRKLGKATGGEPFYNVRNSLEKQGLI